MNAEAVFGTLATLALAFSVGPIILKKVRSRLEDAETDATKAEAESTHVSTAQQLVNMLNSQMALMSSDVELLKAKVKTLEEEGRLNLIWFSELTGWSRSAHKKLIETDPAYPSPPEAPWIQKTTVITESITTTTTQEDQHG